MAVQTISTQVRELEKSLGHQLLSPSGRGVALTEAGQAAFARAEEILQLGQSIPDEVREAASGKVARLAVGLSDGISKFAGQAAPRNPNLRLTSERLVESPVEWYRPARLVGKTERDRFAKGLKGASQKAGTKAL
jgi:LysR family transcriptional activator of nhaA